MTSGPPELPGKICASWPIHFTTEPTFSPSISIGRGMRRSALATMPRVTAWDSASGQPMARTVSPTRTDSEDPNTAVGSGADPLGRRERSSLMTAMSLSGSVPTSVASSSSRVGRTTRMAVARPTTWWLVMTCPSAEMIAPEPVPPDFFSRPPSL